MRDISFPYRQKPFAALFALLFSGSFFYAALSSALTNHEGLSIKGIQLTAGQATAFYWVSAVLCILPVGIFLLLSYAAIAIRRSIDLRADKLVFPRSGFSKRTIEVPYHSIKRVYVEETRGTRF